MDMSPPTFAMDRCDAAAPASCATVAAVSRPSSAAPMTGYRMQRANGLLLFAIKEAEIRKM
jgi:hypothetical protein